MRVSRETPFLSIGQAAGLACLMAAMAAQPAMAQDRANNRFGSSVAVNSFGDVAAVAQASDFDGTPGGNVYIQCSGDAEFTRLPLPAGMASLTGEVYLNGRDLWVQESATSARFARFSICSGTNTLTDISQMAAVPDSGQLRINGVSGDRAPDPVFENGEIYVVALTNSSMRIVLLTGDGDPATLTDTVGNDQFWFGTTTNGGHCGPNMTAYYQMNGSIVDFEVALPGRGSSVAYLHSNGSELAYFHTANRFISPTSVSDVADIRLPSTGRAVAVGNDQALAVLTNGTAIIMDRPSGGFGSKCANAPATDFGPIMVFPTAIELVDAGVDVACTALPQTSNDVDQVFLLGTDRFMTVNWDASGGPCFMTFDVNRPDTASENAQADLRVIYHAAHSLGATPTAADFHVDAGVLALGFETVSGNEGRVLVFPDFDPNPSGN